MSEAGEPAPAKTPAASARPRLSTRKKLGFLALTLLLGVCGVEGLLQLLGFPKGLMTSTRKMWATDAERELGPFKPSTQVKIAWPLELAYEATINELGLRGALPEPDQPLVLCVGDSTTFGSHVADAEAYPHQLRSSLKAAGLAATTLNGGCPRWTISDQTEFLAAAVPRLKPRAVVILFCGNDLIELDKDPARERALRSRSFWSDLRTRLAIPEVALDLSLWLRRKQLEAQGRWPPEMRPDQMRTGDWARPYWARYAKGLEEAVALCKGAGARVLVAAFPGYKELEEEACEVEQHLPAIVRQAGAEYVDLYPAFRASPAGQKNFLLPHDAHASAAGNALIAGEVARALAQGWRGE
ncbi:MAG TPA: hypothetical protein DEA08_35340 [Planctomycetes bacterium]|nr:hypothetical protein [Planctomycetota bacterium]